MSSDDDSRSEKHDSEPEHGLVLKDHDPNEEEAEEVTKDEEGEEQKKVVKPKRVIRNPQPKLNEETLKGVRGISAIENYFERVKFKGKGYEDKDLNVIMKTYEYWCHRLFPKFPFDTCIERLEKLGTKKATQTHIKRIRYNLIVEDKPILDDSDDEQNMEDAVNIRQDDLRNDQFDQLMGRTDSTPVQLSEEQLERMKLNKEKAAKIRQERLEKIRNKAGEMLNSSSQLPTASFTTEDSEMFNLQTENTRLPLTESPRSTDVENMIQEDNSTFNHESDIKGKSNLTGKTIKKKSRKKSMNETLTDPPPSEIKTNDDTTANQDSLDQSSLGTSHLEKRVLRETQEGNLGESDDSSDNIPKVVKKRAAVIESDDDD